MESDPRPDLSVAEARAHLDAADRVRERGAGLPRPFAWLLFWGALMMGAYVCAVLLVLPSPPDSGGAHYVNLLLVPLLVNSVLLNGARERFDVRFRSGIAVWIAVVAIAGGFAAAMIVVFTGGTLAPWVAVIVGIGAAGLMGGRAFVTLLGGPRGESSVEWAGVPLSAPVRWMTALIGVLFGVTAAVSQWPVASSIVNLIGLCLTLVMLLLQGAWSLVRVGSEWGRREWVASVAAMLLLFALAIASARTDLATPALAGGVGGVVLVLMVAVALAGRPRHAG